MQKNKTILILSILLAVVLLVMITVIVIGRRKPSAPTNSRNEAATTGAMPTDTVQTTAAQQNTTVTTTAPIKRSLPDDFYLRLADFYGQTMFCRFPMVLQDWTDNGWQFSPTEITPQIQAGKVFTARFTHPEENGLARGVELSMEIPTGYSYAEPTGELVIRRVYISLADADAPEVNYKNTGLTYIRGDEIIKLFGEPDEIKTEPYSYASEGCYYYYGEAATLILAVHEGGITEVEYLLP